MSPPDGNYDPFAAAGLVYAPQSSAAPLASNVPAPAMAAQVPTTQSMPAASPVVSGNVASVPTLDFTLNAQSPENLAREQYENKLTQTRLQSATPTPNIDVLTPQSVTPAPNAGASVPAVSPTPIASGTPIAAPSAAPAYDPFAAAGLVYAPKVAAQTPPAQPISAPAPNAQLQANYDAANPTARAASNIAEGAFQALPFANDAAAALDVPISYLPTPVAQALTGGIVQNDNGETLAQRYATNLAAERGDRDVVSNNAPVEYYGGQLAGSLALPMGAADQIGGAAARVLPGAFNGPLAQAAIGNATLGAGYGTLYGAGEGDTLQQRLTNAEHGAELGGVAGAAIPIVAHGISALGTGIKNAVGGFINPTATAAAHVQNAIQSDIANGSAAMSPADVAAAQAAGQPVVVGDVGGTETQRLARAAANVSPDAQAALSAPTSERFGTQNTRFSDFVKKITDSDLNIPNMKEDLATKSKGKISAAYQKAYEAGDSGVWNDELASLVQAPDMKAALADADRKGANAAVLDKNQIVRSPFTRDANGNVHLAKQPDGSTAIPTLRYWDQVKRALDDKINVAMRAGNKEDARDFIALKNKLLEQLNTVPGYEDARLGAFKYFKADNAIDAGANFLSQTKSSAIDAMKAAIAKMSPEEKAGFAKGLASAIVQKSENISERRNIISLFNNPATRAKFIAGLGADTANQIDAYLLRESAMDQLRTAVGGNSTTARQLGDLGKAGHGLAGMIGHAVKSPIGGAIAGGVYEYEKNGPDPLAILKGAALGGLAGALGHAVDKNNYKIMTQVGKMLASDNPADIQKAIKVVSKNTAMMGALRRVEGALSLSSGRNPQIQSEPQQQNNTIPNAIPQGAQ